MCPGLFKGSCSLLALAWLYITYYVLRLLSHKAVLRVLLAMRCYAYGYGIVCPSYGLYGSIFIYYKAGFYLYMVVCILTRITLHGGPKKWQKRGRAKRVLSRFCHIKKNSCSFWNSTFKFQLFQEIFYLILPCLFTVHIRPVFNPCQAGNTYYTLTCFQTYSQLIVI